MKKRWLLNLALLAFIVVLIGLVKYPVGAPDDEPALPPLLAATPTTVKTIRIARSAEEEIRLERADQHWRLATPVRARAEATRVDAVLRLAATTPRARFAASVETQAQYGLARPQARVWLDQAEIRIGAAHALEDLYYVGHADEVLLIPGAAVRPALQPVAAFFSTHLLDDGRKPIAFTLPEFNVGQTDGVWTLAPANGEVSSDQINQFVDEWRYARALKVTRHTGARRLARVRVRYAAGSTADVTPDVLEIDILAHAPELILFRPDEGLAYHFPTETAGRLLSLKPR